MYEKLLNPHSSIVHHTVTDALESVSGLHLCENIEVYICIRQQLFMGLVARGIFEFLMYGMCQHHLVKDKEDWENCAWAIVDDLKNPPTRTATDGIPDPIQLSPLNLADAECSKLVKAVAINLNAACSILEKLPILPVLEKNVHDALHAHQKMITI